MSFKDGDFVEIEYSAWRAADNKLVYTTDKKAAEENDIYDKEIAYKPQLIVVGKGNTIKGLDSTVKEMGLNETKKVEIVPKDAFGDRSEQLVKVVSISDFRKRNIDPYPGMRLQLDDTTATVRSVNSGRVIVDANHPLAGERLIYSVKVVAKIDDGKEKVKALAEQLSLKPGAVSVESGTARIEFGEDVEKDANYLVNRSALVGSIFNCMAEINKVDIEDKYSREKQEKQEKQEPQQEKS